MHWVFLFFCKEIVMRFKRPSNNFVLVVFFIMFFLFGIVGIVATTLEGNNPINHKLLEKMDSLQKEITEVKSQLKTLEEEVKEVKRIKHTQQKEVNTPVAPVAKETSQLNHKPPITSLAQNKKQLPNSAYKIETIAKVIWCENRKSEKSMRLVMSVIYNRAEEKTIDDMYKEISKPFQFQCYDLIKGMNVQTIAQGTDLDKYKLAKEIVQEVAKGKFKPLISATNFFSKDSIKAKSSNLKKIPILLAFEDHFYF